MLIHRAAGGVGHLAVQIAKARGAYVIALASAGKHEFVRSLGADEAIDYRAVDFTEVLGDLEDMVDVVFDSNSQGERSLAVLKPGGVLVSIMDHANAELAAKVEAAGRRFARGLGEPDYAALEAITELVEAGRLRPYVEQTFPLEEAGKAYEVLESGQVQGKPYILRAWLEEQPASARGWSAALCDSAVVPH
ncbi:zinc-binding dehydrogenase [Nonomuraea sp. NPDC050691]|uniref:zinc-binding dehydrogenase n=1 Tax=Nonomuraea sp. NPDC050691 TaxID=3155661 RepID=UPI0033D64289